MAVNQRPQWTAVEIAAHAMDATSLSQLTLPEVKRMAAWILDDERNTPSPNRADPETETASKDEYAKAWASAPKRPK